MKKNGLQMHFFGLLMVFITSCNGQVKTGLQNEKRAESETATAGQPKLIKTQGSKEADNVCCGLQDKAGNLWFGTTGEGVYRYNGKSFIQYTVKDGLSSNGVYSILEDRSGNIWLGTVDGICRYNGKNIIPVAIPSSIRPVIENGYYSSQSTPNTVWSMLQDKSGKIWFGTGDGVYCYNGFGFNRFLNNDGVINEKNLHLKMIDCMVEDKLGNI